MDLPKYARVERERRWLVRPGAEWRAEAYAKRLVDLYLECGNLRLREITDMDSGRVVRKLTKKYAPLGLAAQPICTLFLSVEEHRALGEMAGRPLVKVRHYVRENDHVFGVDVFEGALAGLVIAELEVDDAEALARAASPAWTLEEITGQSFFACGRLAGMTAAELRGHPRAAEFLGK